MKPVYAVFGLIEGFNAPIMIQIFESKEDAEGTKELISERLKETGSNAKVYISAVPLYAKGTLNNDQK